MLPHELLEFMIQKGMINNIGRTFKILAITRLL